jgi:Nuclear pore protein 84 / 107
MSSMHLLPSNLINQSVFLSTTANDTFQSNTILEEPDEESFSSDSALTLYQQFFETNQKYAANEDNVFEMLTEFELLCCDHLMVTSSLMKSKVRHSAETKDMNKLENVFRLERNSWRVFRAVFEDRTKSGGDCQEDMIVDDMVTKMSDKTFAERLFERDCRLRQMQLVIDWLERNQLDDSEDVANDRIQFYSEG